MPQVSITYNVFYVDNLLELVKFAVWCGAKTIKIDFCSVRFINNKVDSSFMVKPERLIKNILKDYPFLEEITEGNIVFEMMLPFCLWPVDFINKLKNEGKILSVCHVLKQKGIIFDEGGNLIICNALFDYPIGRYGTDFCDKISLLDWLNKPQIINYYNSLRRYPSLKCKSCSVYFECGGGCPLRWTIYKPDELVKPIQ